MNHMRNNRRKAALIRLTEQLDKGGYKEVINAEIVKITNTPEMKERILKEIEVLKTRIVM